MKISVSAFACPGHDVSGHLSLFNGKLVDSVHFDFMDGVCVPLTGVNIDDLLEISSITDIPLDIHLMVNNQRELYHRIKTTKNLRNIILTIGKDSYASVYSLINEIKEDHFHPYISIWPEMPLDILAPYVKYVDGILIMTTPAGVPNSVYMKDAANRVDTIISKYEGENLKFLVDGGMNPSRLLEMQKYKVEEFVVGRAFFDKESRGLIEKLR